MQREDYPRPNFIRPRFKSLNGEWRLDLATVENVESSLANVPFELGTESSGVLNVSNAHTATYSLDFELNASEISGTTLLNFIGIAGESEIYLNDVPVTTNVGHMHSMHFDVSLLVKEGSNTVKVISRRRELTATFGILGDVWLEFAAKTYFGTIRNYGALMNKTIYVQGAVAGETEGYKVKVEIAYAKKPVATYEYKARSVLNLAAALKTQTVYLWQALEPRFYELRLSLFNDKGGLCDQIYTYCAFRDITLVDNKLYVNGKSTFVRAIEVDGTYPYSGLTPTSSKAVAQDYASLMMLGFNAVHFNRYPTPKELYVADKLGLMVRCSLEGEKKNTDLPNDFNAFATETQMTLNRDFGHPSIIIEIPFTNYNGSAVVQEGTYSLIKQTDPTKLVSISGGDLYKTDFYEFREDSTSREEIEDWLMYRYNGIKLSEKEDLKRRKLKPTLLSEEKLRTMPFYIGSFKAGKLRGNDHYSEVQFISRFAEQVELIMASGAVGFTFSRLYDTDEDNTGVLSKSRDFKLSREGIAKVRAILRTLAFTEK